MTRSNAPEALLVLPHLRVQNANAISSPLTHGFPSITAFTGHMWALQRKLVAAHIPIKLDAVGVVCHHHEEQVTDGYVKTFRLTRNPLDSSGQSAAIAEEGRMHLDVTLLFLATPHANNGVSAPWPLNQEAQFGEWAAQIGEVVARMRIAGGSVLPTRPKPGRRTRPWMALLPEDHDEKTRAFARWRRQWLPGYALVGRDDLLTDRLRTLSNEESGATLLDAWLHAARFNHQPVSEGDAQETSSKKLRWADPARQKGGGWTVPIPVGYAALREPHPAGSVANARDASTPFVFVESVYSFGEWISLHRLSGVHELMWRPETDPATGLYRCRSGYVFNDSALSRTDTENLEFD
ncbi:type I-F CRISPR-associated protein Csy2 [Caballeronia sp. GAWG1-5s-s]|uniref:type I-F CRISPR-associated protein Csy2 n=1 Tax=Caballeronia sp. GAWG1-5s-s TaxID=2921743 RepID=UPI002028DBCB|nr:type I-F CRISPR-associated protein Csy2 [Caballeronia sp. GAWG1-5s-s]